MPGHFFALYYRLVVRQALFRQGFQVLRLRCWSILKPDLSSTTGGVRITISHEYGM